MRVGRKIGGQLAPKGATIDYGTTALRLSESDRFYIATLVRRIQDAQAKAHKAKAKNFYDKQLTRSINADTFTLWDFLSQRNLLTFRNDTTDCLAMPTATLVFRHKEKRVILSIEK